MKHKVLYAFIVTFITYNAAFAGTSFKGIEISQEYSIATEQMKAVATYIGKKSSSRSGVEWQEFKGDFIGKECKITINPTENNDYVKYFAITITPNDYLERNQIITMLLDAYKNKYTIDSTDNSSVEEIQDVVKVTFRTDDGVIIRIDSYWFFSMEINRITIFYYARPQTFNSVDINAI